MYALGRILQFSYMSGTKNNREFSGDYVNLDEKCDLSCIESFCNWYIALEEIDSSVGFELTHSYTQGYLPLDNNVMTIPENQLTFSENYAFIIDKHYLETCIGDFRKFILTWLYNINL